METNDLTPLAPAPAWLTNGLLLPTAPHPAMNGAALIPEGSRNASLASMAGAMRRKGMGQEAILAALMEENKHHCSPPLPEKEIKTISESISRYAPDPYSPYPPSSPTVFSQKWPSPLGEQAFHGLAGQFVRLVEPHTEADRVGLLSQLLVAFGNVVGRGAHFRAEADCHFTNLFAVLVGETAKGRKGTSWGHVRERMRAIDGHWVDDCVQTGLSSGEGLIYAVRDAVQQREPIKKKGKVEDYQMVEVDPGVSDKRLMALQPEFATTLRVLERDGNSLSGVVRQAWDTGGLRILTKNTPAKATEAHISMCGHITKEELCRYLDRTEIGNGFANRILFFCVRRSKVLPEGGDIGSVDFGPLDLAFEKAAMFAQQLGRTCIVRDPEARKLWREVYEKLSEGKPGLFGAVISRAEAQVMRLALIYALLDQSTVIRKEHLEAALEVWRYAEESALYIFGDSLGNPLADEVLSILRSSPEGLTRTEISSRLFGHHKSGSLGSALGLLQTRGLVYFRQVPTAGRSAERWYAVGVKGGNGEKAPSPKSEPVNVSEPFSPQPKSDLLDESNNRTRENSSPRFTGSLPLDIPTALENGSDDHEKVLRQYYDEKSVEVIKMAQDHFPGSRVVLPPPKPNGGQPQ